MSRYTMLSVHHSTRYASVCIRLFVACCCFFSQYGLFGVLTTLICFHDIVLCWYEGFHWIGFFSRCFKTYFLRSCIDNIIRVLRSNVSVASLALHTYTHFSLYFNSRIMCAKLPIDAIKMRRSWCQIQSFFFNHYFDLCCLTTLKLFSFVVDAEIAKSFQHSKKISSDTY